MSTATMEKIYLNNPIKILHRLKEAGFTQEQAEAQVEIFTDYLDHNIATKKDLKEVRFELKEMHKEIRFELKEMEMRITIKTASIVGSIMGFFFLLEKFF